VPVVAEHRAQRLALVHRDHGIRAVLALDHRTYCFVASNGGE
jgi:hypothetical protein